MLERAVILPGSFVTLVAVKMAEAKKMSAQLLKGSAQIAAAALNSRPFAQGERGGHVALFQRALFGLGHNLPRSLVSTRPKLEFDGIFGPETEEKTREFQTEQMLKDDGIVGEQTVFMVFTRYGAVPLVVPHRRELLDRAARIRHTRAAVAASLAESFIEKMNFYLGTLKVSAGDYRRVRGHLTAGRLTIKVLSKKRFIALKGKTEGVYETAEDRIVLREDRNYFSVLGQATCIHELTHAILDDREIPIPTASRDEAIAYLAEAFYLTRRFGMSFKFDRPSVHVPDVYTMAQPLIESVLAGEKQDTRDIRALQLAAMRRTGHPPLKAYAHDGIR